MIWRNLAAIVLLSIALVSNAAEPTTRHVAPLPPMGWNSFDAFGDSVTEDEVLANSNYMKEHLLSHGWNTIVIDYRWYDPGAHSSDLKDRAGAKLSADDFGRLIPAPNRFPSSSDANGFKSLADKLHTMGFKFGIHVMRGIPKQSVDANTPIDGSNFHAKDAANTSSTCGWNPDMFGVNGATDAGQAWYDSIVRQYAGWGVDYIKVDDLSVPYSADEIEAIRRAIDKCGRAIVFSTSPGETPVAQSEHIRANANLWRISGDMWDHWRILDRQFDLIARWQSQPQPDHWPDADMIPFGHLGIRCFDAHGDHWTRFTKDEQLTFMSMWCLMPSPLMLGMNLPDNDDWTNSLLTNDEVLAIDQDALAAPRIC